MKYRKSYIDRQPNGLAARIARRVWICVRSISLAAFVLVAESAFTTLPALPPLPAAESPHLQTRVELLMALDRTAPKLTEMQRVEIAEIVAEVAVRYELDPMLILAVMAVESEFRESARSAVGALGFMQLMHVTAFEFSKKLNRPMPELGLFDWRTNIELGAAYLRFLRDRMGSWPMALASYNWGPTTVVTAMRKNHRHIPAYMRGYEKRVQKQLNRMRAAAGLIEHQPRTLLALGTKQKRETI